MQHFRNLGVQSVELISTSANLFDTSCDEGACGERGECLPENELCLCEWGFGQTDCTVECAAFDGAEAACENTAGCAFCRSDGLCRSTSKLPAFVSVIPDVNEIPPVARRGEVCQECAELSGDKGSCDSSVGCVFCESSQVCSEVITPAACSFGVSTTSPVNGEEDVALSREIVVSFSQRLDRETVNNDTIQVRIGEVNLDYRLEVASNNDSVGIFLLEVLPPQSQIEVKLAQDITSLSGDKLEPSDGEDSFVFSFATLSVDPTPNTMVTGRVFASEVVEAKDTNVSDMTIDLPLSNVKITVDGAEDVLFTFTDVNGNFLLDPSPSGTFFVHIDGKSAILQPGNESFQPSNISGFYPNVGKSWFAKPGIVNSVGQIFLPFIVNGTLQEVSAEEETVIGFAPTVLASNPGFGSVSITVPPNSLFDGRTGERGGLVGISPVPPDRLPGQLPPWLNFPLVITVQTNGPTNFDQPAPVCFPNLPISPDPASGSTEPIILLPGDESALWSFNHDTGQFEVVGPAKVNEDGTLVCTLPGFGVRAPG